MRCKIMASDRIATASAMPRNDGKGADEGGKRPDIPSRPKIRLLAGPSDDGKSAEPDEEHPEATAAPKYGFLSRLF